MDLLRRLLRGAEGRAADQATAGATDDRQQLTVLLRLSDSELANEREQLLVYALEDRLMRVLDESGAGTHETNELGGGYLRVVLLGPDAEAMANVIREHLADAPAGSYMAIRRGPPGTSEERLELDQAGERA